MNTFLPYKSFTESAACLDNKRLGKQRVEAWQIYQTLMKGPVICAYCKLPRNKDLPSKCEMGGTFPWHQHDFKTTPWYNHPAVKMWKGYEVLLLSYGCAMCIEWTRRGYKDSLYNKFTHELDNMPDERFSPVPVPDWITDSFCQAHRSNLLRKDPAWYGQFNWNVPNDLPYIWPVR